MENLNLNIATVNGTGSLSANQLLTKILFRSGWAIGSYNFFPSNIAGLPCLYSIRLNSKGHTGFSPKADILISLNSKSFFDDCNELQPKGLIISDEKDKIEQMLNGKTKTDTDSKEKSFFLGLHWAFPISQSLKTIENINVKQRTLLKNMIYVGLLCEWLKVEEEIIEKSVKDFFQSSKGHKLVQQNLQTIQIGCHLAQKHSFPFTLPKKFCSHKKIKQHWKTSNKQKTKQILIHNLLIQKKRFS